MLKIFLVEDESIVREGLRDNIPWQQYGYEFVGEASDGEMALPLIQKTKPDVLLTDIKMPFMDGLSLSRIVHQEFPDMKIIIISGYDDFEYARQAISVGVEQYLLKPITRANLQKVLTQLRAKIESEQEQKHYQEKFQDESREYEQFSRTNFFVKVFEGRMPVQDIYEEAAKLSLKINAPCYNILMFSLLEKRAGENMGFESEGFARKREELLHYFVRYPENLVFRWNVNTYGVLIKGSAEQMKELTDRCLENVERICRPTEDIVDWYAAVGEPVERLSLLAECYSRVNHLFAYRFLMPQVHIFTEEVTVDYMPQRGEGKFKDIDSSKMDPELIRDFLLRGSREDIPEFVDSYLLAIREALQSRMFQNYLVLHVHFVTLAYVESIGGDKEEFMESAGDGQIQDEKLTAEEIAPYIRGMLDKAMELRDRESDNQSKRVLKKALDYIEENYAQESFSLNSVAGEVNVSANYFSAIFSQAMQVTFIEYVTQKRMEKAKKLLKQTEKHAGDIALEVGYKDPHYFSFVFKKTQGCTPREYRAGLKS
ncbi:MAG: response regulator transcription factor [Lachnospiraceae bacterium]|nr:response regulator transcription factor [Lachnospiraceae bacterium]